jgi:hypothetical protein
MAAIKIPTLDAKQPPFQPESKSGNAGPPTPGFSARQDAEIENPCSSVLSVVDMKSR